MGLINTKEPAVSAPIVIARRWDGLGARLAAMVNAWSVARALDLEFRFIWPRDGEPKLRNPAELFSADFLSVFEIIAPEPASIISDFDPTAVTACEARRRFQATSATPFIDINECFDILAFAGEDAGTAAARFRNCFGAIGWNCKIREVIAFFSRWRNDKRYSAIHIRHGDIVFGEWRHVMAHEKYIPTPFILSAVETLSGADHRPVLVVSDNDDYVEWLKQRYAGIHTARDIFPGYMGLTELQRALVDILAMSRCEPIVASPRSAFSCLAANVGPAPIIRADRMLPKAQELLRGIEHGMREMARRDCLRSLLARDICWYLDIFGESLQLSEQLVLAQRAVELEAKFLGAQCRLARIAALAGNRRQARIASRRALRIAHRFDKHADPLVEGLSTIIAAGCLAVAEHLRMSKFTRVLANVMPGLLGSYRRLRYRMVIRTMKRDVGLCESLNPHWLDRRGIVLNLHYQIAAIELLLNGSSLWGHLVAGEIIAARDHETNLMALRRSGFECHQADKFFDPVLRDLERVTIRFARAIGEAMAEAGFNRRGQGLGSVDGIFKSLSGLQWISGWAADTNADRNVLAVGFSQDKTAYGGPIFITRDDVAAELRDPGAAKSGFAFPVPLHVRAIRGNDAPKLFALTTSGLQQLP